MSDELEGGPEPSVYKFDSLADYLKAWHQHKKVSNPSFSLRLFAKKLEVDHAHLKRVMDKERVVSPELCSKLVAFMELSEDEGMHMRVIASATLERPSTKVSYESNPLLLLLLNELARRNVKEFDPKEISSRLFDVFSPEEVETGLRALEAQNILRREGEYWILERAINTFRTDDQHDKEAHLRKGLESLLKFPLLHGVILTANTTEKSAKELYNNAVMNLNEMTFHDPNAKVPLYGITFLLSKLGEGDSGPEDPPIADNKIPVDPLR